MFIRILLVVALIFTLAGCSTTKKEVSASEDQQLQARVNDLEQQLRQKDEEIIGLRQQLSKSQKYSTMSSAPAEAAQATPKQIQTALKNAGFYNGSIDGKVGAITKEAIVQFQKANGLTADGKIGPKTWAKLREFLN